MKAGELRESLFRDTPIDVQEVQAYIGHRRAEEVACSIALKVGTAIYKGNFGGAHVWTFPKLRAEKFISEVGVA